MTGPTVVVFADGGSRGNPGPAGYGAVVLAGDGHTVLAERAASLGKVTNNVAEYSGLIAGLEAAAQIGASTVSVRMDSKLVIEQMSGRWQVKHPDMKPLARRASGLAGQFQRIQFDWVPRAQNAHADRLANEAMDAAARGEVWTVGEIAADVAPALGDHLDPASGAPDEQEVGGTRIIVVRHGETTWGALGRFAGRSDVPLTARGRKQAAGVAGRLRRLQPHVVLTSPLQRCRDTAEVIAGGGIPVVVHDGLVDGRLGEWTGFTHTQIERKWPAQFAAWRSDADAAPPGGESFNEIRARVAPVVREALTSYAGHTVVLVTHAAVTKMLLAQALGVPSGVAYRMRVDTASLSAFTVDPDGSLMVWAVNETGHLPG